MKNGRILNSRIKTSLLSIALYMLLWKIVSLFIGRSIILPPPETVFLQTLSLLGQGESWSIILASSLRALGGFFLSLVLGCITGWAAGKSRTVQWFSEPFLISIRSIPVLSLILLAIIWFRTEAVPVFICFLVVYPVVSGAVASGVRHVDRELLEMARIYKKSFWSIQKDIVLPSVMPYLLTAVSTGLGLTWKSVVAAEVLSMPKKGLGSAMQTAQLQLETDLLFSWTLVVVLLAAICEYMIQKMELRR